MDGTSTAETERRIDEGGPSRSRYAQVGCQLEENSCAVSVATTLNYSVRPVPHDIAIRDLLRQSGVPVILVSDPFLPGFS